MKPQNHAQILFQETATRVSERGPILSAFTHTCLRLIRSVFGRWCACAQQTRSILHRPDGNSIQLPICMASVDILPFASERNFASVACTRRPRASVFPLHHMLADIVTHSIGEPMAFDLRDILMQRRLGGGMTRESTAAKLCVRKDLLRSQ